MSFGVEELLNLLPEDFRIRDAELGARLKALEEVSTDRDAAEYGPLKSLMSVIAREIRILEEDIDQLGDDFSIETCSDRVVPLIAELVGVRRYRDVELDDADAAALFSLRARTANALFNRQAKGTLHALQQAAMDASSWRVIAIEYGDRIAEAYALALPDLVVDVTASTRLPQQPNRRNRADLLPHTPEAGRWVRRARRWNYPNIGLHVHPLNPMRMSKISPAQAKNGGGCYHLNRLGCDAPLWTWPSARTSNLEPLTQDHVCRPLIRREVRDALEQFYGEGKSICLYEDDTVFPRTADQNLKICHLGDDTTAPDPANAPWARTPADQEILLDPELGRIRVGAGVRGRITATVTYARPQNSGGTEIPVTALPTFEGFAAITATRLEQQVADLQGRLEPVHLVAGSSGTLEADGRIEIGEGEHFRLHADEGACPLLKTGSGLTINAAEGATIEVSRCHVSGGPLIITGTPKRVFLRDVTLVPGLALAADGTPAMPGAPSLFLDCPGASVLLERCVTGPIEAAEFVSLTLTDCSVDAGQKDNRAIFCSAAERHGFSLAAARSTILGQVHVGQFRDAALHQTPDKDGYGRAVTSNTLIVAASEAGGLSAVDALERQAGCIRYCALPVSSRTCRTYRCGSSEGLTFTSTRFIDPDYFWIDPLRRPADQNIAEHADTVGVFHRLRPAARTANLFEAGEDFLRLGFRCGPIFEFA